VPELARRSWRWFIFGGFVTRARAGRMRAICARAVRHVRRADGVRAARGLATAFAASATALGLAFLLDSPGNQSVFVVFLAAVTVSASLGGVGLGLLTTMLSGLAYTFFLTEPSYALLISGSAIAIDLAIFGLVSLLINLLYVRLRHAQHLETTARHTAEQAIQLRDGFLAAAAHDLNNPLTVILGTCQLMTRPVDASRPHDTERCALAVRNIENNARRLAAQIEELLDVACAEAGRPLGLRRRSVDLVELVRRVVDSRAETSRRHDIRLETASERLIGLCDPTRVERVVDNLLMNALKYSPLGGVVALTLSRQDTPDGTWAVLSIRDEGLGVPAADLPRIFEPFRRAGNVGPISGSGIGLASARQIVEEHGGRMSVVSREGAGSIFTVYLPVGPTAHTLSVTCGTMKEPQTVSGGPRR
jgi:signal transduction histidine kinase